MGFESSNFLEQSKQASKFFFLSEYLMYFNLVIGD